MWYGQNPLKSELHAGQMQVTPLSDGCFTQVYALSPTHAFASVLRNTPARAPIPSFVHTGFYIQLQTLVLKLTHMLRICIHRCFFQQLACCCLYNVFVTDNCMLPPHHQHLRSSLHETMLMSLLSATRGRTLQWWWLLSCPTKKYHFAQPSDNPGSERGGIGPVARAVVWYSRLQLCCVCAVRSNDWVWHAYMVQNFQVVSSSICIHALQN